MADRPAVLAGDLDPLNPFAHLRGQVIQGFAKLLNKRAVESDDVNPFGELATADLLDIRKPAFIFSLQFSQKKIGQFVK